MYIFSSFGLLCAFPPLQCPIRCATSFLLDFLRAFLRFNVQSAAQLLPFWTSSVHSTASTSNPPRNFFPFGLPPCIPLLQRPIRHAASSLLDFCLPFLYFNVQSATPLLPFWTSSVHSTTSTSNSPRRFFPFGLPLCIPLLQRPIRRSFSSLLDFLRVFHYFNIQSTAPLLPFWTSSVYSTTSTSNPNLYSPHFLPSQIF